MSAQPESHPAQLEPGTDRAAPARSSGLREILWLGDEVEGDDTDGRIDDLTRFVGERMVVTVVEKDHSDTNHEPLQANLERLRSLTIDGAPIEIIALPMPARIVREKSAVDGERREFLHRQRERAPADFRRP